MLRAVAGALCLCIILLGSSASAFAQHRATSRPAPIDRNGALILIRSTLLALDQANKTGNYSVLRDLGAPGFQVNTAARLAAIFARERRDKLDLSGVAVLKPQLTVLPQIEPNGMMRMAGFFPSVPTEVRFDLLFAPVHGQWRPFGISVALGSSSPVAPRSQAKLRRRLTRMAHHIRERHHVPRQLHSSANAHPRSRHN